MRFYFNQTFSHMAVMLIFIAIGFFIKKIRVLKADASDTVAKLLMWVFLPLYTFRMLSSNFAVGIIETRLSLFVTGVLILAITFVVSLLLARIFTDNKTEEGVFIYAFSAPNYAYIGFFLINYVFGSNAYNNAVIFCVGLSAFIGSVGIYLLMPRKKMSFWYIVNPIIISTISGMIFGICWIRVPHFAGNVIDTASNCLLPLSMILAGITLAEKPFIQMFLNGKAYIAAAIRLIVIPAVVFAILKLANINKDIILVAVSMLSMPVCLNTIIYPKAFGSDATLGTQLVIVSHIFALITVPFWFSVI